MTVSGGIAALLIGASELTAGYTRHSNIVYAEPDGQPLRMDLAIPDGDGPFPAVVLIHGGAWQQGNRFGFFYGDALGDLAQAGFVAATVDYRLAPTYQFPSQVEDVQAAVRYLRTNAASWKIDPQHIGAMGESAGGHLALMLGLLDPADGLGAPPEPDSPSSKVQAVVNFYGSMDMRTWTVTPEGDALFRASVGGKDLNQILEDFLGTSDPTADIMRVASPIQYADANDARILTMHGELDLLVPVSQAHEFDLAARQAGVDHTLVLFENAGHGWGGANGVLSRQLARDFFLESLAETPRVPEPSTLTLLAILALVHTSSKRLRYRR